MRQWCELDVLEQFALGLLLRSFPGQLAFALGQDDERPQNDQQCYGVLGQTDVAGLPSVVFLEYGAFALPGKSDTDVCGKGVSQQAQPVGAEALFDFVSETAVDQQTTNFCIFARQVTQCQKTRNQARGWIMVHVWFSPAG